MVGAERGDQPFTIDRRYLSSESVQSLRSGRGMPSLRCSPWGAASKSSKALFSEQIRAGRPLSSTVKIEEAEKVRSRASIYVSDVYVPHRKLMYLGA